ncbi:MAG: hypothetical protein M1826_000553 [Phylliscum demangeonii]|nr:MAG: hypothetical protein M1826_000553 [Phylliscum demangeonii]
MATADFDAGYDDHPSLSASLEDFEHQAAFSEHGARPSLSPSPSSPLLSLASHHHHHPHHHHHALFDRSDDGASSVHSDPGSVFSPPAERRLGSGRGSAHASMAWSSHRPYHQEPLSRSLFAPRRPSRPRSPDRRRPDHRAPEPEPDADRRSRSRSRSVVRASAPRSRSRSRSPSPRPPADPSPPHDPDGGDPPDPARLWDRAPEHAPNYIRFAVRAEVHQRTEPLDAMLARLRRGYDHLTRSRASTTLALLAVLCAVAVLRILTQPPAPAPVPDLVKVAGLAMSFEPLIFYSENGVRQVGDLQETGVAVWDLGESLRSANIHSAPVIVRELDQLSENLKTLAIELTKFFANVNGDVDGILIVMEWAKRELSQLPAHPTMALTSVFVNLHSVLCRVGVFESADGAATPLGALVTSLFGPSGAQRTHRTLHRTFNEFVAVLEESINSELTYSTTLFGLFEAIDRQFLNLARTVIRESDQQEREEGELLASLWTRVLGPNAAQLRKYEKNRLLLSTVRQKTVRDKHLLVDHNGKLLSLKANLEILRKKLVSPLVRSNDSSTLSVHEQISGLDATYDHLRAVRERQKAKLMEMLYGAGQRRPVLAALDDRYAIEGGQ